MVKRWIGPVSYEIELESGTVVRRHVDHVKKRIELDSEKDAEMGGTSSQKRNKNQDIDWGIPLISDASSPGSEIPNTGMTNGAMHTQQKPPVRKTIRSSNRIKNQPKHLKDYIT